MPSIPAKLRIGPYIYTINKVPEIKVDGNPAYGMHELGTLTIQIQEGLPPALEASCILHEIVHAVFGITGLYKTEEQEEAIVEGLSNGICQVILDNKGLMPYIESLLNEQK